MDRRAAAPTPAVAGAADRRGRHRRFRARTGHDLGGAAHTPRDQRHCADSKTRIRLGEWVIPERQAVLASISLAHASEERFSDAKAFNPDRFVGNPPGNYAWIPYG